MNYTDNNIPDYKATPDIRNNHLIDHCVLSLPLSLFLEDVKKFGHPPFTMEISM